MRVRTGSPAAGSECGETTNILRDGIWVLLSCTDPPGHDAVDHYDAVFSSPWHKSSSGEDGGSCL